MATILFSDAIENPDLVENFDPASDILLFTEHTAAAVKVAGADDSVTLTTDTGSVSLSIGIKTITSGSDGFIRFIDGGALVIGDGTIATVADDLSNNTGDFATAGADQIHGLGGNDTLTGGLGADLIYANAGNDSIMALGDSGIGDTVYGGQGDDYIRGNQPFFPSNRAANTLDGLLAYGNLGDDTIFGSTEHDMLYGGQGDDVLSGSSGDDTIYGNADDDAIYGDAGDNLIFGGQGNDTIDSGFNNGTNTVYGNLGDDLINAEDEEDVVFGGQGNDTILVEDSDSDEVFGNAGNDLIVVGEEDGGIDTITGGEGSDTLTADLRGSNSTTFFTDFNGEEDVISLEDVTALDLAQNAYGGSIADSNDRGFLLAGPHIILNGDDGAVTLAGAAGQTLDGDNLVLEDGSVFVYNIGGAAGSFDGSDAADFMIAGDAGDTLDAGGGGDDTLIGGDGADLFVLGASLDTDDDLIGGDGNDSLTATFNSGSEETVNLASVEHATISWGTGTGTVGTTFLFTDALTVDASSLTVGQDLLITFEGNDRGAMATTGTGDDTLYGADATLTGDTLVGGDGDDYIYGQHGNDLIEGGAGVDTIIGAENQDTLTGDGGADRFLFFIGEQDSFDIENVDIITDFVGGEDKIGFIDGGVLFDQRLVDLSGSTDLADAAQDAYTASTGIAGSDAVLFVFGGRTYAYVNDATVGFSTTSDLLVDITGFTGTITISDFVVPFDP